MSGPLRVPILMYHHVEPRPLDPAPVHTGGYLGRSEFAGQLDWLQAHRIETVTLARALRAWRSGSDPAASGRQVVLTFDDGCKCFLEHALPELERRGMTATLFAVTDELGGSNRWDQECGERPEELLDASELRTLAAEGFEIGCHSASHLDLGQAAPDALDREIRDAKQALESAVGDPVETFCYPYGHFGPEARAACDEAGYRGAVSVYGQPGVGRGRPYALPRAVVVAGASRVEFRLQATGWYHLWRRLPRLGLLQSLRSLRSKPHVA